MLGLRKGILSVAKLMYTILIIKLMSVNVITYRITTTTAQVAIFYDY